MGLEYRLARIVAWAQSARMHVIFMRSAATPSASLARARTVRIVCQKCGRKGLLSKSRLKPNTAQRLAADLRHVFVACPGRGQRHDPCETVFPDLVLHGRAK
jgi:hypothetical protein